MLSLMGRTPAAHLALASAPPFFSVQAQTGLAYSGTSLA